MVRQKSRSKRSLKDLFSNSLILTTVTVLLITFYLFPLDFLNPFNTAWIANSGDFEQHYIGWQFFRSTPLFQFPLLQIQDYGDISSNSIIFTDSIPFIALILKVLPLPSSLQFQYFGPYVFISILLTALLSQKFFVNRGLEQSISILFSIIISITPVLLARATGHTALTSQWLIIAGFILAQSKKHQFILWFLLLELSLLTHLYMFAMLFGLFLGCTADNIWVKRKPIRRFQCFQLLLCSISLLASLYAFGYIPVVPSNATASGYGIFSTNLISILDPAQYYSSILPGIPSHYGSHEGIVFPGIVLLFMTLLTTITPDLRRPILQSFLSQPFILTICCLFYLFAITPTIHLGAVTIDLGRLPYPFFIIGDIFRASGRFVWPLFYFFNLNLLLALASFFKKRKVSKNVQLLITLLLVSVAITDLSSFAHDRRLHLKKLLEDNSLSAQSTYKLHKALSSSQVQNLIFIPNSPEPDGWNKFASYAALHQAKTNGTSLARYNNKQLLIQNRINLKNLTANNLQDALYIFTDPVLFMKMKSLYPQCSQETWLKPNLNNEHKSCWDLLSGHQVIRGYLK